MSIDKTIGGILKEQNRNAAQLKMELESMQGVPASKESIAIAVLNLIPGFKKTAENIKKSNNAIARLFDLIPSVNQFIGAASGAGKAITQVVQVKGFVSHATQTAVSSFSYIKFASAAIDFMRIPAIYIGAAIIGQKVPFTWKKNARVVYSSVLLGLGITAIAFPPAAPVIGLVAALASLGQSIVTLISFYDRRAAIKAKLKKVDENMLAEETEVHLLIDTLQKLENTLETEKNVPDNELEDQITNKKEKIETQLNALQKLHNTQLHLNQKLDKLDKNKAIDRFVGMAFAVLGIIGTVIGMMLPPVGVAILSATTITAFTYILAPLAFNLVKSLAGKIKDLVTKKIESPDHDDDAINAINIQSESNDSIPSGHNTKSDQKSDEAARFSFKLLTKNNSEAIEIEETETDESSSLLKGNRKG